jgi:ADP-dependent NAD(P)H-hydrate dehydratase / NAD(P)H-hydrate epimerase
VIDADAIAHLGNPERLKGQEAIMTPHEGEFRKLFGELAGSKPERALEAARLSGAVVVYKGPDTLVAGPDGFLGFAPPAPAWLATAGTGDVLAGMIAALRAGGLANWDAACAAVWLHGRAAEIAGAQMIADDLVQAIPKAIAAL